MEKRRGGLNVVFVPEEGGESRTLRLSPRARRLAWIGGIAAAAVLVFMFVTWWFLAFQTVRGWQLQAKVDSLEAERVQILALADELGRVEAEYENLRSLFGPADGQVSPDLWLPPSGLPGSRAVGAGFETDELLPTGWPLTEPGFVTQRLVEDDTLDHPGLDIAVPRDSYVRASGAGRVVRVGEDPLYGNFVVLEHGDGYQTVYAHVSTILAERGRLVRRGEVIALSGTTGRSTAPHLHFEILLDGVPIDPLSMVEQPG